MSSLPCPALIVVDMQHDFIDPTSPYHAPEGEQLVGRLASLLEAVRAEEVPVVYLYMAFSPDNSDLGQVGVLFPELYESDRVKLGSPSAEIHSAIAPQPGDKVIRKFRFSGFYHTPLDDYLRSIGIETVIVCGINTNVCCESTARDAAFRGYQVVFLSDGTAMADIIDKGWGHWDHNLVHRIALADIAMNIGKVMSCDEVKACLGKKAVVTT